MFFSWCWDQYKALLMLRLDSDNELYPSLHHQAVPQPSPLSSIPACTIEPYPSPEGLFLSLECPLVTSLFILELLSSRFLTFSNWVLLVYYFDTGHLPDLFSTLLLVFRLILLSFLNKQSYHVQIMIAISLPFQMLRFFFSFNAIMYWLKLPEQCNIIMVITGFLVPL